MEIVGKKQIPSLVILVLVVIAAAVLFVLQHFSFWNFDLLNKKPAENIDQRNEFEKRNNIVYFGPDENLPGFPNESILPMPEGSTVIKSLTATPPNLSPQATRIIENTSSLDRNYNFIKSFLSKENGPWTILAEETSKENPSHIAILAKNENGLMTINMDFNPSAKKTIINFSYVTINK